MIQQLLKKAHDCYRSPVSICREWNQLYEAT